MNHADVLPDPNIDDFDAVGELDYGEDEPDVPGPVNDPQQPSFSGNARVNSSDSLPGMVDGERGSIPSNIGPALPPGFVIGYVDDGTPDDPGDINRPARNNIGPSLPPGFGPSLPDDENSGLPPEPSSSRSIGPALPPHLLNLQNGDEEDDEEEDDPVDLYGPALPPPDNGVEQEDDEDDNVVVGPLPPPVGVNSLEQDAEEYALRRLAYEEEKEAQANNTGREEWMLHLPKKLNNYGLGARTFNKGGGAEKDSSWEETPNEKRRKLNNDDTSGVVAALKTRDVEQEKIANQLNHGRSESLLDSHQKTRQQTTSNGVTSSSGRRAFDREKDMEVRGLKNASADEIKEKLGNLGARFSSSNQQKFL